MISVSARTEQPVVAGVVVGFRPDAKLLSALLLGLSRQVSSLYLVDNGGCEGIDLSKIPNCRRIVLDRNYGLGHALNVGFLAAQAVGAQYVATFDQDSTPPDTLIASLLARIQALEGRGIRCAAVAPAFFDHREPNGTCFPFYKEISGRICPIVPSQISSDIVEVDVLITSGMLVKMSAWARGLRYDVGMFLDYTDTDWCFRARREGFRLFGCPAVRMGHALSDAPPIRFFGSSFFRYSALRRYYYFRNTILFVRKPYVSVAWKKRLILGLILRMFASAFYEKNKFAQIAMMCKGLWSGLVSDTEPRSHESA